MDNLRDRIKVVAFDADDTLWDNQTYYDKAEERFSMIMSRYGDARAVLEELFSTEMANMQTHNLEVPGSSPGWSTLEIKHLRAIASAFFFFCVNNA